ncbi:hypothetical protein M409DRAFT_64754 [Zasmidium cellare ATCC 36951]|uniref:histidine kinase n=1 Tax=Zasmidium cellare ATCC 36951 TaxID=1080233 RepID=A0A6A6CRL1_ZASCE|nr:uncharacterized protein M409DRAFT_64754 [Zasmidium cellare ATCC 36951]KAF2169715.1 hypothetical protein M409DRAFT_64754 [Zasmidium cellare ATCC 36951]
MNIRISVRQQLSLLLILSGCIGLAVLAIATWIANHQFVLNIAGERLETTASLKAAQLAYNLELMQTAATFVTTRAVIQGSLARYNNGSANETSNWALAEADLEATLGDVGPLSNALVLQAMVFSRNTSGPAGSYSVFNGTGYGSESIALPWNNDNGTRAHLGDPGLGYPPALYPNLTVSQPTDPDEVGANYVATYNGFTILPTSTLVLGPLLVNETFSLLSLTLAVMNTTNDNDVLGWITVTTDARLIQQVIQDQRGLGKTGQTLLLGPVNSTNLFAPGVLGTSQAQNTEVRYLLPLNASAASRHSKHIVGTANPPFLASSYPAVADAMEDDTSNDTIGSVLRTHNEENKEVSVGFSAPPSDLVDWVVIVEQSRDEVWEPINTLRTIILACLFGVAGFLFIVSFPLAHWFIRPIIWLRAATEETIDPPHRSGSSHGSSQALSNDSSGAFKEHCPSRKDTIFTAVTRWRTRRAASHVESREGDEKKFRIPGKVKTRKSWIKDEMSDLIKTFNEMSDELFMQYTKLEDRVRQRTIELEQSKKAAEAANESKTLFVANVSHELKTPLNGILGMCAVCMEEDDPHKLRRSLGIIYKSGDLLLRTLNDLLTFSTNQVGHQVLMLEEKEFILRDLETQVISIFGEQAKDRRIHLCVAFDETHGDVFGVSGKLRDVTLWGDIHRLLQVIINLVSNSLKFTPENGSVTVTIRCLTERPARRQSVQDHGSQQQRKRDSTMLGSVSSGTANFINPREASQAQEKTVAPPGKDLFIEFEVKDTGPGIAPEDQHRIFEPFVQGDVGLSRKHSGTGLGLSICSQLASLMRGSIAVKSKLGEGSSFTMKVPLRHVLMRTDTPKSSQDAITNASSTASRRQSLAMGEKPETSSLSRQSTGRSSNGGIVAPGTILVDTSAKPKAERKNHDVAPSPTAAKSPDTPLKQAVKQATKEAREGKKQTGQDFSNVRVLVAEDNKVNQEVILRMLKLEKISDVTIAEDGQKALDLVKSESAPADLENVRPSAQPFDLIFMDVQMPNMDGLTSTRLIRQSGFKRPIVALTAFAEQSNIEECYGSGMDYFLAKPIKRPQLKKVLTDYCSCRQ